MTEVLIKKLKEDMSKNGISYKLIAKKTGYNEQSIRNAVSSGNMSNKMYVDVMYIIDEILVG